MKREDFNVFGKNKPDMVQEEVEVVELFDDNGDSIVFELLATIPFKRKNYFVLTQFVEDESLIDSDVPTEVFVMQVVVNEDDEKMLSSVTDKAIIEEVYAKFQMENSDEYDFADTDIPTESSLNKFNK